MKFNSIVFLIGLLASGFYAAALPGPGDDEGYTYTCDYNFHGIGFAKLEIYMYPDGRLSSEANTIGHGSTRKVTLVEVARAEGEKFHAWFSKDGENEIELIAFRKTKAQGNSVLINHNVRNGQEIWGNCY